MQVFDFTGGREITHPPAKSGIKEQLPERVVDRFAFAPSRIFALIHLSSTHLTAPLAARATSMPPSRSAVKARKMRVDCARGGTRRPVGPLQRAVHI
jgi:hypothetical protein